MQHLQENNVDPNVIVDNLVNQLNKAVDSKDISLKLLDRLTDDIQELLGYAEVSLWTINHNDTKEDGGRRTKEDRFLSASLLHRKESEECVYDFSDIKEYVHTLAEKCLFAEVRKKKPYESYSGEEAIKEGFTSINFIREAKIEEVVVIPITDNDNPKEAIAILELSRTVSQIKLSKKNWNNLSTAIHEKYSFIFQNYSRVCQNAVVRELFNIQKQSNRDVFFEGVRDKLREYCPCQGLSIFQWNTALQKYRMVTTTGLKDGKKEAYYPKKTGLTGLAGDHGKAFISDDLSKMGDKEHIFMTCEELDSVPQTGMFVPMVSTTSKMIVGILRFVNKKNRDDQSKVDYFNNVDKEIMEYAANYLSPVVDSYVKDEEQDMFMNTLSHEVLVPLECIHDEINCIKNNMGVLESILCTDIEPHLEIIDNNVTFVMDEYEMRKDNLLHRYQHYESKDYESKEWYSLETILKESKKQVKHLAKQKEYDENNIEIPHNSLKEYKLYVNEKEFVRVFRNLFENAIKYADLTKEPKDRHTTVTIRSEGYLTILVENNGIRIDKKDREHIFDFGYRGKKTNNVDGYGMGLTLVKNTIESYKGEINLRQVSNGLTSFEITLPKNKDFYREDIIYSNK